MMASQVEDNFKELLQEILKFHEMSDITINIGPERKSFQTHKLLLSMFSEEFRNIFFGSTMTLPSQKSLFFMIKEMFRNIFFGSTANEIHLTDVDEGTFEIFLKYVYTQKLILNSVKEALSALRFSEKYKATWMRNDCVTYLENNLSSSFVIQIYETANEFQITDLQNKCGDYIKKNIVAVFKSESFKYAHYKTVLSIVSDNNLMQISQLDLYNAIVNWGRRQIQEDDSVETLRKLISPLLQYVKFLSMSLEEFSSTPCSDGILLEEIQLVIFKQITRTTLKIENCLGKQWDKLRKAFFLKIKELKIESLTLNCTRSFSTFSYFPTITERFQSDLNCINVYGVTFEASTIPKTDNASFNAILIAVRLEIINETTDIVSSRNVECLIRKKSVLASDNIVAVYVHNPVLVKKGDICKILLQPYLFANNSFNFCKSDCRLNIPFKRLNNSNNNGVHFIQILFSEKEN